MPTKDEIADKIKNSLMDALGVDDDEVVPEATLSGDLGAESIDFLDIVFRLEKAFDIKIPRGELFPENLLTDANFVADGKFTDSGMNELRERMPFADLEEFAENPEVSKFGDLFTVQMISNYIESKVDVED
ncbi:MAG: acyl carrier protein [Pirellulales bacterium]|nr:acyl carrier protein [Planctomycetales bacterium]